MDGASGGAGLRWSIPAGREGGVVIVRIWHGWTTRENADAYERLVRDDVLPEIGAVAGYAGAEILRADSSEEVEFTVITRFASLDAVRNFAGEDYEAAVVPSEARKLLLRFDERARHYTQVALVAPGRSAPA